MLKTKNNFSSFLFILGINSNIIFNIAYNLIKVKIYKESEDGKKVFIGCIHFFNNEDINNRLKKRIVILRKRIWKGFI